MLACLEDLCSISNSLKILHGIITQRIRCRNRNQSLFPVDIELLDCAQRVPMVTFSWFIFIELINHLKVSGLWLRGA